MGRMKFDIVVNRNELMKKIDNDVIIKRKGNVLVLNKKGVISIISDNKDTSSKVPDSDLIKMIELFWGRLSIKQENWIFEKIKFIIRNNCKYIKLKGIKDIQFI
jgi:ribosomal protein L36